MVSKKIITRTTAAELHWAHALWMWSIQITQQTFIPLKFDVKKLSNSIDYDFLKDFATGMFGVVKLAQIDPFLHYFAMIHVQKCGQIYLGTLYRPSTDLKTP